ncbi:MAG TPA: UvrD-helicase domain-containing protein [Planctomycetota bacterium]|nr:UvrD-helicase domain-containing protein [Planctomycetota bacterium]
MAELTPEQRAAALAGDRAVAVVAGAGTGKTRVLTERYLDLVMNRGVPIPRILAVTFTEKAAREMKERIRGALRGKGRADLARQAEFAPVSTIHAFLARMLKERALDAGLDPRFAIADEITAEFLREEAMAETVDAAGLSDALVDLAGAEGDLRELYEAARATPLDLRELKPMAPDLAALAERMARFLADCAEVRLTAPGTGTKLAGLREGRARFAALDPDAAEDFHDLVKGGVAAVQRDLFAEGKEIAKLYRPLARLARAEATGAAVVDTLARLDEAYTARKRAEGLLDFSDLEREGLKLLRSPAGEAVLDQFDHLLVDEYQDTNRLQEAILERLASRAVRFGVGDEKQSIYRFRHADAAVFQELRSRAKPYPLGGSFRSRPELVAFTNALFRDLFAGTGVAPQDLRAEAAWREKEVPSVELIATEAENAAEGRRREATAIARRLRAIVEGKEIPRTAAKAEGFVRYGDCAMLLRSTTNLVLYERALGEEGVPYVVIQGRGYYAAREVVDLAHLLLLLSDPGDTYRAVAAMTSLFCGVPDGDLLHLPGEGPLPLRAASAPRPPPIPPARWERLRAFADRFRRWRAMAQRVSTGDLVEAILLETRFAELMLLEPDGRRRYANLRKALRRARQTTEGYAAFGRSLLEFRERELRESEAPVAAEDDDVLKIMTIHAAKGLEFPLVVAADLTWKPGGRRGPPFRAADGRFSFKLRGEDGNVEPPGYEEMRAWDAQQDAAEEMRLLYVALTRAEEHLVLSGSLAGARKDNVLVRLLASRPEGVRVVDPGPLTRPDARRRRFAAVRAAIRRGADLPADVPRDDAAARALLARVDAARLQPPDATPYVAAAADLVEFERCPRRYRLQRMLGIELEEPPEGDERPDADEHPRREIGTAFHEIMEKEGPGALPDAETVKRYFPPAGDREVEKIRRWCGWLAAQPIVRGLGGSGVRKEMPFLVRLEGLAIRGKMDLYSPDPPLLLDWKTGEKVRAAEYEVQVAVYLAALRALGLEAPDHGKLVYVDAEEIVDVPEKPVKPLIEAFRAAHRGGGAFAPTPGDACLHCEFKRACIREGVPVPRTPTLFE